MGQLIASPDGSVRRARVAYAAAVLSVAVLITLVLHNGYWADINQRTLPLHDRPHVSPRDIDEVASQNTHPLICHRLAIFYTLRRLEGATLTIPPWLAHLRWHFEQIGRLEVVVGTTPFPLPQRKVRRLLQESRDYRPFLVAGSRDAPDYRDLYLLLDERTRDYVLAESESRAELFVLPMSLYRAYAHAEAAR